MSPSYGTSTAIRERNVATVLETVRAHGPASRADLAQRTGLSKPTVGGALRSLEDAGLVREYGRTTGRRGPSASLYEHVPDAVLVLGVDIGARYVRAVLADLDGAALEELTLRLERPHVDEVLSVMRSVRAALGDRAARTALAVVGSPGVVDPATGHIEAAPNIQGWEGVLAEAVLSDALQMPVQVENDVNLAALGEAAHGGGRGAASFAYLSVGSGLGAGIVLDGRLHRGARGAAGEIGFLPVGDGDGAAAAAPAQGGPMEARLSSRAIVALAEELSADPALATRLGPPFDVQALFDGARRGDALGREVVAVTARRIAACVAAVCAVVDVELVLLGGGIGANGDLLLPGVREAAAALLPAAPRIEQAHLGDRALRDGAVAVGLELARAQTVTRVVAAEQAPTSALGER